jgi:hypothetical protein
MTEKIPSVNESLQENSKNLENKKITNVEVSPAAMEDLEKLNSK